MARPSSLANGSGTTSRSTSSRQGSFDSFGSNSIQNPGVVPSPLNSSPALSSGMAQSYGAASSGFANGLNQIGPISGGTAHSTAASSGSVNCFGAEPNLFEFESSPILNRTVQFGPSSGRAETFQNRTAATLVRNVNSKKRIQCTLEPSRSARVGGIIILRK